MKRWPHQRNTTKKYVFGVAGAFPFYDFLCTWFPWAVTELFLFSNSEFYEKVVVFVGIAQGGHTLWSRELLFLYINCL